MSTQILEVALYTSDGCTGTYEVRLDEGSGLIEKDQISWDGDPEGQTITAQIGDIQIDGNLWRDLEDEGDLSAVLRAVASGKAATAEDVAVIGGVGPR